PETKKDGRPRGHCDPIFVVGPALILSNCMLRFYEPHMSAGVRKTVIVLSYRSPFRLEEGALIAKKATRPGARKNFFKATLTRFAHKRGSRGRARFGGWRKILMHRFAPGPGTPDPVSLVIFAIDRVGPAAV